MKKKIVFPPTLRELLVHIIESKTVAEQKHWKAVALRYISFLEEYS